MAFIECRQVVKAYRVDQHEIVALRGIDFSMERGEWVAIVGPSGAGKSSLLNLLGGLDRPTAGQLRVDDLDLLQLRSNALANYRLNKVGFLWQQTERNLISHRSALRNVTLPMTLAGVLPWQRTKRARELLDAVGLADQVRKHPATMSGGQQQRVALAVALANHPSLLLADEPTGALDRGIAKQVMALLQELRQRFNLTILMVTHDLNIASYADRILTLRDGALGQDLTRGADSLPHVDEQGRVQLPDTVRQHLIQATLVDGQPPAMPSLSIEIRPEGVLLRPEVDQVDDMAVLVQDMLPQDAPPSRRAWFRRKKRTTATPTSNE